MIGTKHVDWNYPYGLRFWVYDLLVGTRDGRTQSACACKPALLHLALKTWVSGPRYLALRTWVSGPRQTHRYRTPKALHPMVVLSFSRHFSLCPPSLFSASSGHRQTHRQATLYIKCAQVMMLWTKWGHNHYIFHNYINIINPIVRHAHPSTHGLQDRSSTEGNCEIHLAWIWKVLISWALVKSRMFVDLTWHVPKLYNYTPTPGVGKTLISWVV
jgi:hypothetical protein